MLERHNEHQVWRVFRKSKSHGRYDPVSLDRIRLLHAANASTPSHRIPPSLNFTHPSVEAEYNLFKGLSRTPLPLLLAVRISPNSAHGYASIRAQQVAVGNGPDIKSDARLIRYLHVFNRGACSPQATVDQGPI